MESGEAKPERTYLADVRVVELADEQAEYGGRLLVGLGADVIKVEPPGGNSTRSIGPFYQDVAAPDRSLYFWNYNLGKRSVVLDLKTADGRAKLDDLLAQSDVLLESTPNGYLEGVGLGKDSLLRKHPSLILARISPFGDVGPWKDYKGSDLVHLALGGPMMNTGYDPEPDGTYDLPPIAPQMWHSYHIAGEQLVTAIVGALLYRRTTGRGQYVSCAVHDAVSKNTEMDLMNWIMRRAPYYRQTCRHAGETIASPGMGMTKDGRWIMYPMWGPRAWTNLLEFLDQMGMAADLHDERYKQMAQGLMAARDPEVSAHVMEVVQRALRRFSYERVPWKEAQNRALLWTPVRRPHENALDEHWLARGSIGQVEHKDLGRSFAYALRKWVSTECEWKVGPEAPKVGEHSEEVLGQIAKEPPREIHPNNATEDSRRSRWGKPFALRGVRILDFSWLLASGGAARFLSSLGAEVIKVEWKDNLDMVRQGMAPAPVGGREAREKATAPLPPVLGINTSGQFNDFRPGHRGISLNVRDPRGLEIAKRLVATSDIIAEGFSPGVMESWGLGYDAMREVKPDVIFVRQSGMGLTGTYGRFRAIGPTAASLAGITDMSGLPDPAPPAGWGYSYLDWFGAYNLANAMIAALYYRERTGKGQMIDSSQVDCGIFINGTAIVDWSANGRIWQRYGNRSPYKPAAPHGAYRCAGLDRWVAIACFTEEEWRSLAHVAGHPEWTTDQRFATLEQRLRHQDELDQLITSWTVGCDAHEVMHTLQASGVPAGVCQNAEDRYERDEQLKALEWLTEVTGTEIGTWPVKEFPVQMNETPPFMGGEIDRGAPCYGEDNGFVYRDRLGLSRDEIDELTAEGVI